MDLREAIVTEHAAGQMAKRETSEADVPRVLALPDEVLEQRPGPVAETRRVDFQVAG